MKKKHVLVLLFCLLLPFSVLSQSIERVWTTLLSDKSNVLSSNIHYFEGKIGVSVTDEDALSSFLRIIDSEGSLLGDLPVQAFEYLECSHYSDVDKHFYFGGSNASSDSMIFSKIAPSGATIWRRSMIFNNYSSNSIYSISENGDELLVSYSLFNFFGPTINSAIGYFVFDRQGNIVRQNQPFLLPASIAPFISYASVLDQEGNAVLSLTNFLGACSILKFDRTSGQLVWKKDFDLENNDIQSLAADEDNNIFFSGYDNKLIKLAPDGASLFNKNLGITGFHGGQRILLGGEKIYVFGYQYPTDTSKSQIYIGQFNQADGEANWAWYFDSIPNLFGLGIHDAVFSDDSTLYVIGSASAEFDFIMKLGFKQGMSQVNNLPVTLSINVSPNPTLSGLIQLNTTATCGRLTLCDISGNQLLQQQISGELTMQLPYTGTFFLLIENEQGKIAHRIIYMK